MANLLSGGQKKQTEAAAQDQENSKKFANLSERTRLLEERVKQAHQKIQVVDETSIKKIGDIKDKITNVDTQLSSLRKDFDELREMVRRIVKDVSQTAKMSDVRVLEKYINMVDITRLITKDDVYRILDEHETEKKRKKTKKKD